MLDARCACRRAGCARLDDSRGEGGGGSGSTFVRDADGRPAQVVSFDTRTVVTEYAWCTAESGPGADPVRWQLHGSNDPLVVKLDGSTGVVDQAGAWDGGEEEDTPTPEKEAETSGAEAAGAVAAAAAAAAAAAPAQQLRRRKPKVKKPKPVGMRWELVDERAADFNTPLERLHPVYCTVQAGQRLDNMSGWASESKFGARVRRVCRASSKRTAALLLVLLLVVAVVAIALNLDKFGGQKRTPSWKMPNTRAGGGPTGRGPPAPSPGGRFSRPHLRPPG